MNKINLKMLRGAKTSVILKDDAGNDMELELKPIPFKRFLAISENYGSEVRNNDGTIDKTATAQKNAAILDEMLIETFITSYPEMNKDEAEADLELVSSDNIQILIEKIMEINGLNDKKVAKVPLPQ